MLLAPFVLLVAGTRPEAIKLAPVAIALRRLDIATRICLSGQHPELAPDALGAFGLVADHRLRIMHAGQTLEALHARGEAAVGALLDEARPALVIVQGDTTTALAAASAAAARGIAVAHVEAGLRSHDIASPFPEEANRIAIAALATLHFAPTEAARANLIAEGVAPAAIEVTGNTVVDALRLVTPPDALPGDGQKRIVATLHRRENRGTTGAVFTALASLAARADTDVLLTRHPSFGADTYRRLDATRVRLTQPMAYREFVAALAGARLVVTDSGGIQEETAILGVPTLVVRANTERPEALAAGTARLVGAATGAIVAAATRLLDDDDAHRAMARPTHVFGDGHAGERIAQRIASEFFWSVQLPAGSD